MGCASDADWQIVVTHFPPERKKNAFKDFKYIGDKCGLDLIVSAHRHQQELHDANDHAWVQKLSGIPYVVTGGGGGVTSERYPGDNTQYGYMDMTIAKDQLKIESFNFFGNKKGEMTVQKRYSLEQQHADPTVAAAANLTSTTAPGLMEVFYREEEAAFDGPIDDSIRSEGMPDVYDIVAAQKSEF